MLALSDTRIIQLTHGHAAIVDAEDFDWLSQWNWIAHKDRHTFYAVRNTSRKLGKRQFIRMHRLIINPPKGIQVDHRDGNGLNNSRSNLRYATCQQNAYNRRPQKRSKSSKYKGVSWHKGDQKWHALIKYQQKLHFLGAYSSEYEAALAYNFAAFQYFGVFARMNEFSQGRAV